MKRTIIAALLALVMCLAPIASLAEEAFDSSGLVDWFNDSTLWVSVENGHWSKDPADKPTHEEIEKMLSMAMKAHSAGGRTPWFFIVIDDVEAQRKVLGDYVAPAEFMATEGTVTILAMSDHILEMYEGHVDQYGSPDEGCGYYGPLNQITYYDVGMAAGMLQVAAASMGYNVHMCGSLNGEYAEVDIPTDRQPIYGYQTMNPVVKPEYMRSDSWWVPFGTEPDPKYVHPVEGNAIFVCAIVMGKPASDETIETWGSLHNRPDNWAIWDGVVNENPSPSVAARAAYAEAHPEGAEGSSVDDQFGGQFEVGENEYLGFAMGVHGKIWVKATVVDGVITGMEVIKSNESEVADEAIKNMPAKMVELQTPEVDGVAGATIASNAIKVAAERALKAAGWEKAE